MQKGFVWPVILVVILLIGLGGGGGYFYMLKSINDYQSCVEFPFSTKLLTYPGQCRTPDGQNFTQSLSNEEKKKLQPPKDDQKVCIQVITPAKNPKTSECKEFPTPCDVPEGWEKVGDCNEESVDKTLKWMTYKNPQLSFSYPSLWIIYSSTDTDNKYWSVYDDKNHPTNEFNISIDQLIKNIYQPNKTDEELIEDKKNYEESSTAGLGNYNPEQTSKTTVEVGSKKGIKYTFLLKEPQQLQHQTETWIYMIDGQNIIRIRLIGKDVKKLNQILNSVHFLQ